MAATRTRPRPLNAVGDSRFRRGASPVASPVTSTIALFEVWKKYWISSVRTSDSACAGGVRCSRVVQRPRRTFMRSSQEVLRTQVGMPLLDELGLGRPVTRPQAHEKGDERQHVLLATVALLHAHRQNADGL